MTGPLAKVLVVLGGSASLGFGIWHFFVPAAWRWYSYIDAGATELVIALRAINILFSLSLVLFGLMTLLLVVGDRANRYTVVVILAATSLLWFVRVLIQVVYPQGSMSPLLQGSMLASFVAVFVCHAIPLALAVAGGLKGLR